MAARLLEAWDAVQRAHPDTVRITPEGQSSTGKPGEMLIPDDPDERQTYALRIVAQRCVYGVDKNPLAAEMAKLSLWLLTLAKDKPFEFLDHAIRCGDSLVGIHNLDQLRKFNLDGKGENNNLFLQFLDPRIKEAIGLRRQIAEMQANTVEDVEIQDRMLREANEKIDRLKSAADMLISAEFEPGSATDKRRAKDDAAIQVAVQFHDSDLTTFRLDARNALAGQGTFHWPLEFPEVFSERIGFDAVVGNPPWGQKVIEASSSYKQFIQATFPSAKGIVDLFRPFVEQGIRLLRPNGCIGLVLPDILLLKNYPQTRKFILDSLALRRIGWHGMIFPGAVIDAVSLIGHKATAPPDHSFPAIVSSKGEHSETTIPQQRFCKPPGFVFNLRLTDESEDRLKRFDACPRLGTFFEIHEGVHSGNIREELFVHEPVDTSCREMFFGRDELRPYSLRWGGRFIRLSVIPAQKTKERYANAGRPQWFEQAKVLVRRTGDYVLSAVDTSGRYASNNYFIVFPKSRCHLDLYGLAALLNSRFMTWYFRAIVPRTGRAFAELKIQHLEQFPLPHQVKSVEGCAELNRLGRERANVADLDEKAIQVLDLRINDCVNRLFGIGGWSSEGEPL